MNRNFRLRGGSRYPGRFRNFPEPNPGGFRHFTKPNEYKESSNYDCNYNDTTSYSQLFLAVHDGQLNLAHSLLKDDSLEGEVSGKKLIHIAAARGHEQIICLLCKRNAVIDKGDRDGNTPLHLAIKGNHIDVINLLLNEATVNLKNIKKETPLHVATKMGNFLFVDLLLKGGAKVDEEDEDSKTPLHISSGNWNPNIKIIINLLTHGASVHASCKKGYTPLHYATTSGSVKITELMIERGASINLEDINGISPFCLAIQKNKTEMVKFISKQKISVDPVILGQMTPLHFAAETGNEEIVKLLVTEEDPDNINARAEELKTPFHLSVANGHTQVSKYLIQCGAEIDTRTKEDDTPLHLSAAAGNLEIVSELLERGAKIDTFNISGFTPLALATKARNKEVVKLLLNKGASATHCQKLHQYLQGFSSLHIVQHDVDVIPAFHIAAKTGDEEMLKIFLKSGVEVDFKGKNNKTALHYAAICGHRILVEELIKSGADINSRTKFMKTPLHLAAASGRVSTVKYLLKSGAKILTTDRGYTPLHYVLDRERHDAVINPNKTLISRRMSRSLFISNDSSRDVSVTPSSFEKFLQITEMLLIKGASSMSRTSEGHSAFYYAFKIKVSKEEQSERYPSSLEEVDASKRIPESDEFRPEIVRCLLNYTEKMSFIEYPLDFSLRRVVDSKCLPLIDSLLEYCHYDLTEFITALNVALVDGDLKIILAVAEKIPDTETIVNLCNSYTSCILRLNLQLRLTASRRSLKEDGLKLLIAILVKMRSTSKVANFAESREFRFLEVEELHKWYTQCELEVMNMQEKKIHPQFDITFYDILTKPVSKLSSFARNITLMQTLDSGCFKEFPAYSLCLERSIEKGKDRKELIELTCECFLNLIEEHCEIQLPSLIIDKIFEYLSVAELRKLSATLHNTPSRYEGSS